MIEFYLFIYLFIFSLDYKLLHHVILVDDSFIKDLPNTKYFSNLFSVNGSNISLTFSAENLDAKFKFFSLINDIISKIKDKQENKRKLLKQASNLLSHELVMSKMISNNIPLNVSAIGTEERNYSTIDRYTVYIIVIELNDFSQRIYLRYSEIVDLYDIVRKQFPKINIPKIARNHWFTYRKTKIIESRKMLIENFLQMLLKNENVINDCAKILSFLNLPLDLYDVHLKNLKLSNPNELDLSASVASSNLLTKYLSFSKSNIITDNLIEGFGNIC